MISTYGLYWKESLVDWGRRGRNNEGELWGSAVRGDEDNAANFREQRGIYALYSEFDLVYVGQTGSGHSRLLQRLRGHLSDHLAERWDRFSWFGMRRVLNTGNLSADTQAANTPTEAALNIMEAVTIAISEPRLNLQRGNWAAADATQYFQIAADREN